MNKKVFIDCGANKGQSIDNFIKKTKETPNENGLFETVLPVSQKRVKLKEVNVEIDDDNNAFNVVIDYTIIGEPSSVQTIDLFLERTRA